MSSFQKAPTQTETMFTIQIWCFCAWTSSHPIAFTFPEYTPFWNREESTFGVQIYRILGRLYTPVTIHFLPLYTPSEEERQNPKLFAENVRVLLRKATGSSLSQYDVKDSPNYRVDVKKKVKASDTK